MKTKTQINVASSYKKLILIVFLVNFVLVGFLIARLYLPKKIISPAGLTPAKLAPSPIPTPSWKLSDFDLPESDKIEITGVSMNNFYKISLTPPGQIGEVMFVDETNYKITYFPIDKGFLIAVLGSPFSSIKSEAEQKFIDVLGISKEDACKLLVVATTPYSINPSEAGREYKLSWCAQP